MTNTRMLWIEITNKCPAECTHCLNFSSPTGDHTILTNSEIYTVLEQAAEAGVKLVQWFGGDPTQHPMLPAYVDYTLTLGMEVEVFATLVTVSKAMWRVFERPGVRLATSFYSDDPTEHRTITNLNGFDRIRGNIAEALRRNIPLRVGIVHVLDGQRVTEAKALLTEIGVKRIGVDRVRAVGRQAPLSNDAAELCGRCGDGIAAVLPDGSVAPCPLARWMATGDVRTTPLTELLATAQGNASQARSTLAGCGPHDGCNPPCEPETGCDPSVCGPDTGDAALHSKALALTARGCNPDSDGNDCSPAETDWTGDD